MKISIILFTITLLLASSGISYAQTPTVSLLQRNAKAYVTPKAGATNSLQGKILSEIERRITQLNNSLQLIAQLRFLSETEKNTLTQRIQEQIQLLTQAQLTLQSETDQLKLRERAQETTANHPVFRFYIAQARVLTAADNLNSTANLLFDYAEKLETRIAELKATGAAVGTLETNLSSMKAQITSAQTLTTSIMSQASSATPDGTSGKNTLLQASKNIKQATNYLRQAFQTGNKIRIEISQMTNAQTTTPSSSPSASSQ